MKKLIKKFDKRMNDTETYLLKEMDFLMEDLIMNNKVIMNLTEVILLWRIDKHEENILEF